MSRKRYLCDFNGSCYCERLKAQKAHCACNGGRSGPSLGSTRRPSESPGYALLLLRENLGLRGLVVGVAERAGLVEFGELRELVGG